MVGLSRNGGCRRADHDPFDILCGAKYEACVRAFDDGPIKDTPCRFASLKDCFREVRNAELEKIVVLAIQVDDLLSNGGSGSRMFRPRTRFASCLEIR